MSEHRALAHALRQANLAESRAASDALDGGGKVECVGEVVVSPDFIATYRVRAAHVLELPGEHWRALAGSTREFVEHLDEHIGSAGEWLKIHGDAETYFLVFRSLKTGAILGCMRTHDAAHERPA